MALRAMYKGFKKVLAPLIINRPGALAIDQDALNAELNTVFFPRSEQLLSGVGNYLPRYHDTETINGVTYTVGSDDVVTVANTATGYSDFTFTRRADKVFRLPVGEWKIIPHKTGTDESYINIGSGTNEDGTGGTFESWASTNGSVVTFTVDEAKSKRYISVSIAIAQNKTANSTWQPMIVPATAPDDTPYVPFAMTNQQLTDRCVHNLSKTSLTEKGLTFTIIRKDNVVTIAFSGEATEAILNATKIVSFPQGYELALSTEIATALYFNNISDGTVGMFTVKSDGIYANTNIASGDKPRGSCTFGC